MIAVKLIAEQLLKDIHRAYEGCTEVSGREGGLVGGSMRGEKLVGNRATSGRNSKRVSRHCLWPSELEEPGVVLR